MERGLVQESIWKGDDLLNGHGLDMLPVPISTPGFDNGPYLTSANWVSKDPDTGIYNISNYCSQIKAPNRNGGLFLGQHMGESTGGDVKPREFRWRPRS
jgi:UbiD family decarboxylase